MIKSIVYALGALFWAAVFLLALDASAVDDTAFPHTLVDSACTDTNDTPTAVVGGGARSVAPQISGSADGFCDHDSRIREAAIVANTTGGPYSTTSWQV